jgi:hypothetical protein
MLLFRSEEHVDRWCRQAGLPRGGLLSVEQCWRLAQAWYSADRRDPAWRRLTVDEAEACLADIGLTGDFWRLRE